MVDVVLPVLNEAEALPWVLDHMPVGYRAIVVDNGSTDGSPAIAQARNALLVHEPRRGYGAACHAGLRAAESDVVCFMDADGALDPSELPRVADPITANRADLVLGSRRPRAGAWPLHARVANRVLGTAVARRTGVRLRDLGPMRAARREMLLGLGLADRRSGWPLEMVLAAAGRGMRIIEVPVDFWPRRGGRPKETGTVGGTLRAVRDMTRLLLA
jgi:glycosyltransferase involved in cell wall biosynthesis